MLTIRTARRAAVCALAVLAVCAPLYSENSTSAQAADVNAEKVVQYAKSKTYITSRPNEVTRFYGLECDWCSMFVYYCAYKTGVGNSVPNTTFCDSQYGYKGGVEIFKSWNEWQNSSANGGNYVPVRGDVIYFDWDLDGYSDHVGFVDYVSDGRVHTVEGNSGTYGDCVKLNTFPLSYSHILGYGTPDYSKNSSSVTPTQLGNKTESEKNPPQTTAAAETKTPVTTVTTTAVPEVRIPADFRVSSEIGAWLRAENSSRGKKLGILSTDQIVTVDRISGNWVHILATSVEESDDKFSGWTAITNLEAVDEKISETTTAPPAETASVTTTTTTTTVAATTAAPTESCTVYRVDSAVGARFRSSPRFDSSNTVCILDTDTLLSVYRIDGDWAYVQVSLDDQFTYGYVHISTIVKADLNTSSEVENTVTYKVTSDIGCWFRSDPEFSDDNLLDLLDTDEEIEVINVCGDWAFAITADDEGHTMYGYVHTSNIKKA